MASAQRSVARPSPRARPEANVTQHDSTGGGRSGLLQHLQSALDATHVLDLLAGLTLTPSAHTSPLRSTESADERTACRGSHSARSSMRDAAGLALWNIMSAPARGWRQMRGGVTSATSAHFRSGVAVSAPPSPGHIRPLSSRPGVADLLATPRPGAGENCRDMRSPCAAPLFGTGARIVGRSCGPARAFRFPTCASRLSSRTRCRNACLLTIAAQDARTGAQSARLGPHLGVNNTSHS